eukprot:CAMPEP_0197047412 /NCGR_PEP_ID=MMETSP1384-20130603/22924_1 /TAXON_ID=29189 /ORGANISM="Ammonia sp." /LENGTH=600 /DNA_ID=CAMNT_0042479327 /DNA_START=96 /DNA_END=1898 /DNA_ORIENTATION=-
MSIQLKIGFDGGRIDLYVNETDTIGWIKRQISEQQSISVSQQRLLYRGKALDNEQSVAYYNMRDLDNLILQRQATSRQFWISLVYFGSFVGLGLFMGAPGPILKQLEQQTNSTLAAVSFVFSARAIGYIIGSIVFGLLSDKYASYYREHGEFTSPCWPCRPHHLYGICLMVLSVCMSLIIYVHNIESLTIIMAITGMCSGGIDCFGNVLLLSLFDTDNEKDDLVAPYMQFLHFAFAIGAFLSPLIIELSFVISADSSYRIAFWIMSGEAVLFGLLILFITTPLRHKAALHSALSTASTHTVSNAQHIGVTVVPPVQQHSAADADERSSILSDNKSDHHGGKQPRQQGPPQRASSYGSFDQSASAQHGGAGHGNEASMGTNTSDGEHTSSSNSSASNAQCRHLCYRIFVVLSCAFFLAVYVGSEVAFGGYITTYSMQHLQASDSVGRYMSAVYWGGLSFGRLAAVYISKKLRPIHMLIFDLLGCFVAASILYIFESSLTATWCTSVLYGFFMASIFPCIFLIAEETVKIDGKYASIMIFGASLGEFIIPTTEGNLMHYFGVDKFSQITMVLVLILFAVMLALFAAIYFSDIAKKIKRFFSI